VHVKAAYRGHIEAHNSAVDQHIEATNSAVGQHTEAAYQCCICICI
jgi:hypothetical protein